MRTSAFVTVLAALTAAAAAGGGARADSPPSGAAHMCLQGPQFDYYEIVNETDASPPLDFGGLVHGSDQIGPYVIAANHGECVSFVALNSKGKSKGSTKGEMPLEYLTFKFTQVFITSQ
ncbi:MAG: hypothetical protein ACRDL2_02980 [Gaiellaceae bacterium]